VWLFREKIYFIISDTANQHSWNIHRHHETIMHTWKSHRKWGQADVLQTLCNTYQVRIFAVTVIIPRKTSHGTPQYLLPNASRVP